MANAFPITTSSWRTSTSGPYLDAVPDWPRVRSVPGQTKAMSTDGVDVPYDSLHPDTLRAVVAEFITRAGTDYGARERTLDEKIADVMRQLRRGEATVVFDPRTATVNIVPAAAPIRLR